MADFNLEMTRTIPQLRRYARALVNNVETADDLVQDCLERACSRKKMWDESKPIRPWLFTILHNIYANEARRFHRTPVLVSIEQIDEAAISSKGIDVSLKDLRKGLDMLSEEHRNILLLVGLEQLSYKETAEVLDIPVGTVMSRLTRARKNLHGFMNEPSISTIRRVK